MVNTAPFASFELLNDDFIDSLSIRVLTYQHKTTGAIHYHFAADDDHKVFMVALRTLPMDSTGVAHILEHTVLCGSEKYPVRDPFFMMIRRSINSFMNAFTSSDWTAYPFATENDKDFRNLLEVYMDAVFFPNLHELDFAQEGHRFEFETMEDASSPLTYKGVVFNEMKGAMSSPVSTLWQALTTELYPSTTYHYNSGGEPVDIPNLTHEQLVKFHQDHYHPSNSVFMTYGNQNPADLQQNFEELALKRFSKSAPIFVGTETRLTEPKVVEQTYALDEEDTSNKTHIVLSWLLGENQNPLEVLKAHLLSSVLFNNSSSPLLAVLEQTDLGVAPSPLCGLEDSNKEMVFAAGVQGSEPENAQAVEDLILGELARIVKDGVEQELVDAMLHQLELSQREVGGDSYPYGLEIMLSALPAALHQGDPVALLDLEASLAKLQQEIADPKFIPNLIQTWLLDNPHRVRLTLKPDTELSAAKAAAEKQKLAEIQAGLSKEQQQEIIKQAQALEERQAQIDDPNILPKVTKEDVNPAVKQLAAKQKTNNLTGYEVGTNGLVYQQLILDLPELTEQEQAILPLFNATLSQVGSGGRDYLATQALRAAKTGGIAARSSVRADLDDANKFVATYKITGKALNRHQQDLTDLMDEVLNQVDFAETKRIQDLVGQMRASITNRITGSGHTYAMGAATQSFSTAAKWAFERGGLAGINFIKEVDDSLKDEAKLAQLAESLAGIREKIAAAPRQGLLIADEAGYNQAWSSFEKLANTEHAAASKFSLAKAEGAEDQAWITSTSVNFCAQAHQAVMPNHPDAPLLAVLGACLRNGFLHSAIREKGGAYGGGSSYNASAGAFVFFSYRDPRLLETYADFERALNWLNTDAKQEQVDEAILNIISALDKPGSPAGEAIKAFYQDFYGNTPAKRQEYRSRVLAANLADLQRVADKYLTNPAVKAVICPASEKDLLAEQGFVIYQV